MLKEQEDAEERVRRKKDKRESDYFNILINNKKVSIVGYRIKDYRNPEINGQVFEILSRRPLDKADNGNVIIDVHTEKENLEITGVWKYGVHRPGNYQEAYFIEQLIRKTAPEE